MRSVSQIWYLFGRHCRDLVLQPLYLVTTLVQPLIWLILYGQSFRAVTRIPDFGASQYVAFLTPGVIIMSAMFTAGWTGMGIIDEIDRGIMERMVLAPLNGFVLILGRLLYLAVVVVFQAIVLTFVSILLGAHYAGGVSGAVATIGAAVLLAIVFGSISSMLAFIVRKHQSIVAVSNFLLLPLSFLSPVFIVSRLMPHWIQMLSRFNPVTWAVTMARTSLVTGFEPRVLSLDVGLLSLVALLCVCTASASFERYKRTL
jgi:ABC-2 type transport system permease protein